MNRRALFKSVVASVCIGTAQQLGVKDQLTDRKLLTETDVKARIAAALDEAFQEITEDTRRVWVHRHQEAYNTLKA